MYPILRQCWQQISTHTTAAWDIAVQLLFKGPFCSLDWTACLSPHKMMARGDPRCRLSDWGAGGSGLRVASRQVLG